MSVFAVSFVKTLPETTANGLKFCLGTKRKAKKALVTNVIKQRGYLANA